MSTIIISLNNRSHESQMRDDLPEQEPRARAVRAGLRDALLEAEAIRKGQQQGTTWQAFLAELDQESLQMQGTDGLSHSFS